MPPLRKRFVKQSTGGEEFDAKAKVKKSKRQQVLDFFRSRKHKKADEEAVTIPVLANKPATQEPSRDPKNVDAANPAQSNNSARDEKVDPGNNEEQGEKAQSQGSPSEVKDAQADEDKNEDADKEDAKAEALSDEQIHTLFAGAPHFAIVQADNRPQPSASYPWDFELTTRDVSDSKQLAQPAFSAATLRRHLPVSLQSTDRENKYEGYDVGVVELPSVLSAQGLEPGSIGFIHFLELPISDHLVTDLQQSQSSNGYLESVRNKEQMQSNPEKLGIRRVDMEHVFDRLAEFGDLVEAFQDSPERMTILNNQSSGDLYANLFGKFLSPPPYDGSADDPTGMKVQIDTLLKILRLTGVWHDFSLVEWRIRLGQILWTDLDVQDDSLKQRLWTDRDILLLQLTLSCELLLRLDAITSMEADDVIQTMHVSKEDYEGFLDLKTRKTDWDLVLARRFLDNILVTKETDAETPKPRGLLSMLSKDDTNTPAKSDIVLLPRHQARQLSGLLHFAETIQWPGIDLIVKELAHKLNIPTETKAPEEQASTSPYGKFLEPATPSSVSVYGTPLATPRSPHGIQDSYFGNLTRPKLDRTNTARSLTVPLSSTLLAHATDGSTNTLNVGGWLSRSLLTGLVLPGEAISHFLMSTLLENDKLAIAALGDSANLYGGFIYSERSWWSKSSIVGRVLACLGDAVECMGWISFTKLPAGLSDSWYAINSEQVLQRNQPPRIKAEEDIVARDSAILPGDKGTTQPEDLTLPRDLDTPPVPSIHFASWTLKSSGPEVSDNDEAPASLSEAESHVATLTFSALPRNTTHSIKLTYDVQFVTSFPCTPPSTSPTPSTPQVVKNSLSRSSSKRSIHSTRLSRTASRRNSHGFEPLLSHPPDSPSIAPTQAYSPVLEEPSDDPNALGSPRTVPMNAHPLHSSYRYQVVTASEILDAGFSLPFKIQKYASSSLSSPTTPSSEQKSDSAGDDGKAVLVLDARSSNDLELLARAWCAEKGLHALLSRTGRSCLACSIREARGLGINVVIRL